MKKFTKILCCVLGLGFLLGGCATVGSIRNSNNELIYNGNSAVMVDGYLYYGNAFSDISAFSSDKDYKNAAKLSYLARLNTNIDLEAKSEDYSPKNVEKVAGEVAGFSNDFMFVLGNYIYYATPNRQKALDSEGNAGNYYNYTTIYRSQLNGNGKTKIYTTNGEITQIEVLKHDENYYIVMLAGTDLIKIKIGNKISTEVVAEDVTSVAIPKTYQKDKVGSTLDWNGYIFYTTTRTDEDNTDISGSDVKRVLVSGGDAEVVFHEQGTTITFIGREKDVLFYTKTGHETEVFISDITNDNSKNALINNEKRFFSSSSISDISLVSTGNVDYGYIFINSSGALMYADVKNNKSGVVSLQSEGTAVSDYNVLFISGRTVYLSTTTSIYKADLSSLFNGGSNTISCETVVTMTAIYDGTLYAFDGTYIYYYAKLEEVELEEDEEETVEEETDDNYYLYRTKASKNSEADAAKAYELLGKTQIESRQTK